MNRRDANRKSKCAMQLKPDDIVKIEFKKQPGMVRLPKRFKVERIAIGEGFTNITYSDLTPSQNVGSITVRNTEHFVFNWATKEWHTLRPITTVAS